MLSRRARTIGLAIVLSVAALLTAAANYPVNSFARSLIYVSTISANSIPIGSDTGATGGRSDPLATCDAAYALVASTPSATILFNGTAATLYNCNVAATLAKTVLLTSVLGSAASVTLAGTGAGQAFKLQGVVGATLAFSYVTVDPSANSGGPGDSCFDINGTNAYNAIWTTVVCQGFTTQGFENNSSFINANLTFNNVAINGGNVIAGMYLHRFNSGTFTINGGSTTLTQQNILGFGGLILQNLSTAVSPVAPQIINHVVSVTVLASLPSVGIHYPIRLTDMPGALISGGSQTFNANGTLRSGDGIACSSINQVADNCRIAGVTTTINAPAGIAWLMGVDGAHSPRSNNMQITDSVANVAAGAEGWVFGSTSNSGITRSICNGCGGGAKDNVNFSSTFNVYNLTNPTNSLGIIEKGNTGSIFSDERVNMLSTSGFCITVEANSDTAAPSTGAVLTRIRCSNNGGTNSTYVAQDAGMSAVYVNGTYENLAGTLSSTLYQMSGTNFATCTAFAAVWDVLAVCNP
jgi:hypothetical protein